MKSTIRRILREEYGEGHKNIPRNRRYKNSDEFLLNKGLEYEYPKQWEHDSPTTYKQA